MDGGGLAGRGAAKPAPALGSLARWPHLPCGHFRYPGGRSCRRPGRRSPWKNSST